eukprot:1731556-Pyramimonas_sp.AAC.1
MSHGRLLLAVPFLTANPWAYISRSFDLGAEPLPSMPSPYRPQKKGTLAGVVYRAQGPALGSWEDRPPAAFLT